MTRYEIPTVNAAMCDSASENTRQSVPSDVWAEAGRLDEHYREIFDRFTGLLWPISMTVAVVTSTGVVIVSEIFPNAISLIVKSPPAAILAIASLILTLYLVNRRITAHLRRVDQLAARGYYVARQGRRRWLIDTRSRIAHPFPNAPEVE